MSFGGNFGWLDVVDVVEVIVMEREREYNLLLPLADEDETVE
jgi:hypothetical protein